MATAIWDLSPPDTNRPNGDVRYAPSDTVAIWRNVQCNPKSLRKRYGQSILVSGGYRDCPSTEDVTHRRGGGHQGKKVSFTASMDVCVMKEEFLKIKENKQMFIDMLGERLEQCGNQVMSVSCDADLLIAKTAVEATSKSDTVLVGDDTDDTDLLVLLCQHHTMCTSCQNPRKVHYFHGSTCTLVS